MPRRSCSVCGKHLNPGDALLVTDVKSGAQRLICRTDFNPLGHCIRSLSSADVDRISFYDEAAARLADRARSGPEKGIAA